MFSGNLFFLPRIFSYFFYQVLLCPTTLSPNWEIALKLVLMLSKVLFYGSFIAWAEIGPLRE